MSVFAYVKEKARAHDTGLPVDGSSICFCLLKWSDTVWRQRVPTGVSGFPFL